MMKSDRRIREEVLLDKELNTVLKETDILELRKKIRKISSEKAAGWNPGTRILMMAASLLILLSAEFAIYYLTNTQKKIEKPGLANKQELSGNKGLNNREPALQAAKKFITILQKGVPGVSDNDPLATTTTYDLLASYQPDKALENLIGTTNRSGSFRMLKPAISSVFSRKSTILFSWKTEIPLETSLVVENNTGLVVYESDSNYNQSVYLKASFLNLGLYYYKIMRKDEVIYFGKFTIQ